MLLVPGEECSASAGHAAFPDFYSYVILEEQIKTTPDRLRQVMQERKGNLDLGIFRQCFPVLLPWAAEIPPTLDLLMPVWVQVHRSGGRPR